MTLRKLIERGLLEKINQIDVCGAHGRCAGEQHAVEPRTINNKNVDVLMVCCGDTMFYDFFLDSPVRLTTRGLYVRDPRSKKEIELMFIVNSFFDPNQLVK